MYDLRCSIASRAPRLQRICELASTLCNSGIMMLRTPGHRALDLNSLICISVEYLELKFSRKISSGQPNTKEIIIVELLLAVLLVILILR